MTEPHAGRQPSPYTARQRAVIDDVRYILKTEPGNIGAVARRIGVTGDTLRNLLNEAGRADLVRRMAAYAPKSGWSCGMPRCNHCGPHAGKAAHVRHTKKTQAIKQKEAAA